MRTTSVALLFCIVPLAPAELRAEDAGRRTVSRIAFGSCAHQDRPQPVWEAIIATKPDLFIWLGDNVYGDTEDMAVLKAKYGKLGAQPGYQQLLKNCSVLATWDDHDFGVNDGGREYPKRVESQKVFLDFFNVPNDAPQRKRAGVYSARVYGPEGRRVQVILLDTRYFRSPLKKRKNAKRGEGPYEATDDPKATVLGDEQWKWLEEQLKKPAELRIIGSSIQVIPEDHHWEKWMNHPRERKRLFEMIRATKADGVVFLSGDRHLAEISMMDGGVGYPLFDVTSSGLNFGSKSWRPQEVNRHRVGTMNYGDNYGLIEIEWDRKEPRARLQIRDAEGDVIIQRKVKLSTLKAGVIK